MTQIYRTVHLTILPIKVSEIGAKTTELENVEKTITSILDSNRTLEAAAFSGGKTALHHAAARGDDALVRMLLERGCIPHLKVRASGKN